MIRRDLLALDEAKLAALATKGHVKRAVKDLAAGRGPSVTVESDGTVVATLNDIETRLPIGAALRDAPCTCTALKVCRHRVMAVLAYREMQGDSVPEPPSIWSPAEFTDVAIRTLLGRWALQRATRRHKRGYVADVVRAATPSVELPTCTIRFLVRDALGYARCDCEAGVKCEHIALAVWAFRRADELRPEGARVTVELGGGSEGDESATGALDAASTLVRELLLDGARGSGAALAARFARAKKPLAEAHLQWPLSICEDLEATLSSYADRGATYHPTRVAELLTELHARARAARTEGEVPRRSILGADEPTETPLEHLRLVSLGCRLSREPIGDGEQRVLASVYLADPDTQTVLVLRKTWELADDEVGAAVARRHVGRNMPLGTLARGQMVTKAAKRRANRALVMGRGGGGRTSVTPQRGDWSIFEPPLHATDFSSLGRELRALPPACVRPRHLAGRVRVLSVTAVDEITYHPGEQKLSATVSDENGDTVQLELAYSSAAPGALDALATALRDDVRYLSGEVWREGHRILMTPLAVVTDRVVALDLESAGGGDLGDIGHSPSPDRPIADALTAAREHLDRGSHEGLRHVTTSWREQLASHTRRLEETGLKRCAARSAELHTRLCVRSGGDVEGEEALARAWLDASLRIRLTLEAGF